MGNNKKETVARYHREHYDQYRIMFRKEEDAALLKYIEESESSASEILKQAMKLYMEKAQS